MDQVFSASLALADGVARDFALYERPASMAELAERSEPDRAPHTFDAGEGILIPAEILEQAARGVRNFVILQPFGCLPNHVVGRGIIKRVKELYPDAQVLPLDYDPDVSQANIENRLQMLVMDARADVPEREDRGRGAAPRSRSRAGAGTSWPWAPRAAGAAPAVGGRPGWERPMTAEGPRRAGGDRAPAARPRARRSA